MTRNHGYPPAPCPKCGRLVQATGEAAFKYDGTLPIYECSADSCNNTPGFRFCTVGFRVVF